MIGDWVLDKAVSDNPVQIEQINEKNVHYKRGNGYMSAGVELLEPVLLTDAILKANGFEYHHKNFAALSHVHPFQLKMVEWPDENGIGLWMIGGLFKIRYVHELQHAMKLCEIDKEIKLED